MSQYADSVDHNTLKKLVRAGTVANAVLVAEPEGWAIVVQVNRSQFPLAAKTGQVRRWANADSAIRYLDKIGIHELRCDARQLAALGQARARRPDASKKLKEAHQALDYDRWFREQVAAGQAAVEAGEVSDIDDVFARLDARAAAAEAADVK